MHILLAVIKATAPVAAAQTILFLGNSHTTLHDVPGMVRNLLSSAGPKREIRVSSISGGWLEDIAKNPATLRQIDSGQWTIVVLQAQKISMSHKIDYPRQAGIDLAKRAKSKGARAIFFAEWPRRGIAETDYIYRIYAEMAKASASEVAPVGHVWDGVDAKTKPELWASDGNHSSVFGAYAAALGFYFWIAGPKAPAPAWRPKEVAESDTRAFVSAARAVVAKFART